MGFSGSEMNERSPVAQWLANDGLGGVILFDKELSTGIYGKNLKNQTQIKHLTRSLKEFAGKNSMFEMDVPLFVAVDYEGGAVDRLSKIEGCLPTMKAIQLARLDKDDFEEEVSQMAMTLKSLGFNLNFAPVVDLNLNDQAGIIGYLGRSFSSQPDVVALMAQRFVEVLGRYGIVCCYKHFPGHGSASDDTHEGFVDVTDTFQSSELQPYVTLLQDTRKPYMVMTAHVVNRQLDSKGLPATLSHDILTGLLRQQMAYDGVIISDDLQMQAISNHYSVENSIRLTINAGADMMIFANQLGHIDAVEVIDIIEHLVRSSQVDSGRIDEAYRRVMRLKQQVGVIESKMTEYV